METYLHVKLKVEREKYGAFIISAKKFLDDNFLQDKGWTFLLGFEVTGAALIDDLTRKPLAPPPGRDLVSFINVWKLPPDVDVATVMLELSELASYVNLDNNVALEEQDIVFRINEPPSYSDEELMTALRSGASFAMVRHYIFRDDLAKFAFSSAGLAQHFETKTSYAYAGCYQAITGLLNEFWDVWKVTNTGSLDPADVRTKLTSVIGATEGLVAQSYKEAIYFDKSSLPIVNPAAATDGAKDGPDDGIIVVKAAPYWTST